MKPIYNNDGWLSGFELLADVKKNDDGEFYIDSYSMDDGVTWIKPCTFKTESFSIEHIKGGDGLPMFKDDIVIGKKRFEIPYVFIDK